MERSWRRRDLRLRVYCRRKVIESPLWVKLARLSLSSNHPWSLISLHKIREREEGRRIRLQFCLHSITNWIIKEDKAQMKDMLPPHLNPGKVLILKMLGIMARMNINQDSLLLPLYMWKMIKDASSHKNAHTIAVELSRLILKMNFLQSPGTQWISHNR